MCIREGVWTSRTSPLVLNSVISINMFLKKFSTHKTSSDATKENRVEFFLFLLGLFVGIRRFGTFGDFQ